MYCSASVSKSPGDATTFSMAASPVLVVQDEKKRKLDAYLDSVHSNIGEQKLARDSESHNPDQYFGMEVAERLNTMSCRTKALAKVRIQEILYDIQFGAEN